LDVRCRSYVFASFTVRVWTRLSAAFETVSSEKLTGSGPDMSSGPPSAARSARVDMWVDVREVQVTGDIPALGRIATRSFDIGSKTDSRPGVSETVALSGVGLRYAPRGDILETAPRADAAGRLRPWAYGD
jgi:hypothetical protein